ncbi:MAG TPA: type II toxin-antitoxin system VapC family toxin [Bacillota bacterium]|nr:type II toxin-antitoxin system VapC family toxin [Bacillota bacterium]
MSGPWRIRESGLPYAPLFIVDSSVALATVLPEPWSPAADQLFRRAEREQVGLIVPDLFWYEVANVLRYRLAEHREDVTHGIGLLAEAPLATLPLDPEDLASMAETALDENLTVYDACYLVLARQMGSSVITEDKKLLAAAGGRYSRSLNEIGL